MMNLKESMARMAMCCIVLAMVPGTSSCAVTPTASKKYVDDKTALVPVTNNGEVVGYVLGGQLDKMLASTNYTDRVGQTAYAGATNFTRAATALAEAEYTDWVFVPSTYNGYPIQLQYIEEVGGWVPWADNMMIQTPVTVTTQTNLHWDAELYYPALDAYRSIAAYRLGPANGPNADKPLATAAQGARADAALPKADVVDPAGEATVGQAADAVKVKEALAEKATAAQVYMFTVSTTVDGHAYEWGYYTSNCQLDGTSYLTAFGKTAPYAKGTTATLVEINPSTGEPGRYAVKFTISASGDVTVGYADDGTWSSTTHQYDYDAAPGAFMASPSCVVLAERLAPGLIGNVYDFSTQQGLYSAVRDIVNAMGGTVTNFPSSF